MGRDHHPPVPYPGGGAVHRRGRELLQYFHLYQRRGHRPAGLLLPGGHGGEPRLPPPAAAHLLRAEKREYRPDGLSPGRDARGGEHHLHRPDAGKRHLAGRRRQLVSGADYRRPAGDHAHYLHRRTVYSGCGGAAEPDAFPGAVQSHSRSDRRHAEL